jgi:sterol desaturase/sphingolipid hydroxylase (fatty acid hydroxylase superfamily)
METVNHHSEYQFRVYPNEQSPKLFKHPLLELLTKTRLWIIWIVYSSVNLVLLGVFINYFKGSITASIGFFVAGFFTWTFGEYVLHRFVYHKIKDASYDEGLQYVFHGIHHQYPSDDDRIILPPVPGLLIAAGFLGLYYLIMGEVAFPFSAGFLMGYLTYISIHWMVHSKPVSKRVPFWWNHHNIHHYQQHDKAFGVTTPIWDMVFGTMPIKGRRTITILNK